MTQASPEPRWATVKEAANHIGLSVRTIRRYISTGRLDANRLGPRRLEVDLNEVDKLRKPIEHEE
jgi:excisionase family DNA binding protein